MKTERQQAPQQCPPGHVGVVEYRVGQAGRDRTSTGAGSVSAKMPTQQPHTLPMNEDPADR